MIYFQIIFLNNHRISTYIDIMPSHSEGVWFGCILWHINYSWLFNAKLSSYVYIRYIYMIWYGCILWHINYCWLLNAKSSLYIYIKYIRFGLCCILWHINYSRLFNTKSSLYIYIRYIWFGLVVFNGISTILGYLMPNPLYTYILDIYDLVWLYFIAYQLLLVI